MILFYLLFSFLLGSIPFGYIIVKRVTGKDIRTEGSGNIGSTNVKRVAGRKISALVQFLDISKGLLAVFLFKLLFKNANESMVCVVAEISILGHIYSPFLCFKGGKGINTTLGAFFLICPAPVLASVLIHILLGKLTKIVSIRSIVLGFSIPVICLITNYGKPVIISTTIIALLIVLAHKDNIKRLYLKTES